MGTKTVTMDTIALAMAHRNRLPEPKRFQSVVEWQFPRAHRYFDDCGKLIAVIEQAFPGLICQGMSPDGFRFVGSSHGITAAHFYWEKASVSQVGKGDAGLADATVRFWSLVQAGLGISSVSRLGHRTWLLYETNTQADANHWLSGFRFLAFDREGGDVLGTPDAGGSVIRTKLEVGGRRLRLEVNAGTASINQKQVHGVFVDADIVLEPLDSTENLGEFVSWNGTFIRENIEPWFRGKK
ncbi:MAG: hypothetical protein ABJA98_22060 [Acidobacteriota bacterium]